MRKTTLATYEGRKEGRYENNAAKRKEDVFGERGKKKLSKFWLIFFTGSSDFTVAGHATGNQDIYAAAPTPALPG